MKDNERLIWASAFVGYWIWQMEDEKFDRDWNKTSAIAWKGAGGFAAEAVTAARDTAREPGREFYDNSEAFEMLKEMTS